MKFLPRSNNVTINVLDIQRGKVIAELRPMERTSLKSQIAPKKLEKLMNSISYIHFDEARNEIITGHENGSVVLWN